MKNLKPILNTANQIVHLQSKGVKFNLISVDEAKKYLELNNNYFKLRAYRKNRWQIARPIYQSGLCNVKGFGNN